MAKKYEFEVATPVSITYPEDFSDDVSLLGAKLFDTQKKSGAYVRWGDSSASKASERKFFIVKPEKLRYLHFSRAIEPFGEIGFQFAQLALTLDPALRGDKSIGTIDLQKSIHQKLYEQIGACSLEGMSFDFTYVDAVQSSKYEQKTVFVLRQLTNDTEANFPLDIISGAAQESVAAISPEIYALTSAVEEGIPVAETTETNQDKIQQFQSLFSSQFLDSPIRITAGEVEIKTVI